MNYLCSSLSLDVLDPEEKIFRVNLMSVSVEDVRKQLSQGFQSNLRNPLTAQFLSRVLEMDIPVGNIKPYLNPEDLLIIPRFDWSDTDLPRHAHYSTSKLSFFFASLEIN